MDFTKLQSVLPEIIYKQLPDSIKNGNCTDAQYRLRTIHFLAQTAHESNNFNSLTENLNYSYEGLMKTFKFSPIDAEAYAHQPERIANKAYANKGGNGNEQSGDGWKYRGRGCLQTTLKDNYIRFFKRKGLPLDSNPDLLATTYPMESASFYFTDNGIWEICDEGNSDAPIEKVTGKINKKKLHLAERIKQFRKFEQILNSGL